MIPTCKTAIWVHFPTRELKKLSKKSTLGQHRKSKFRVVLDVELFGVAAKAGLLSGSTGIESIPGPELPKLDFLNRFNGLLLAHVSR